MPSDHDRQSSMIDHFCLLCREQACSTFPYCQWSEGFGRQRNPFLARAKQPMTMLPQFKPEAEVTFTQTAWLRGALPVPVRR